MGYSQMPHRRLTHPGHVSIQWTVLQNSSNMTLKARSLHIGDDQPQKKSANARERVTIGCQHTAGTVAAFSYKRVSMPLLYTCSEAKFAQRIQSPAPRSDVLPPFLNALDLLVLRFHRLP